MSQTPFTPADCGPGGGGPDVENVLLCDVLNGEVVGTALAVYEYDDEGNPVGPPTFVDPATGDPYVVQGALVNCSETSVDVETHHLCDVQPDNSVVRFVRTYVFDGSAGGEFITSRDMLPDGSVYAPTGNVTDCEPADTCSPSPAQDLQAECGPGEAPDAVFIADQGVAPDARVDTDPNADPLCGGTWVREGTPQSAPFPINETFRNATFDQPGPVTQGTAPYFALTADPANHGAGNPPIPSDAAGQGWGRMSGINSFTNGMWQVPTPFPTAQGMTFECTLASHTGTAFGGDGTMIGFTDGSVPPQSTPIGGGGGLGAGNWQGGYVGVVFDEFGGLTGVANTVQIRRIGPGQAAISPAVSVAPRFFNQTTRAQPYRARVSILEQFGQTFVSVSIDWNDGNGPIQYFDRFRVDQVAGPAPATLRMGVNGSSGGAFRSNKEIRDAVANQGGVQWWRQFPITTDPLDACVETVDLTVCVDHTFDAASETTGNGEPEAWLWLVNVATDEVLAQRQWSSNPNNLGTPTERCVTLTDVTPADLPNIRIMVGAETRDAGESFDHTFDNMRVTALGQGCPAERVRTVPISAPCPIPVIIVGGDAEGGGGGTAEFESASTFQYVDVCMTVGGQTVPGWMREVRDAEGNVTRDFLGQDGIPATPEAYTPGSCAAMDTEVLTLCDAGALDVEGNPTQFLRRFTFNGDGSVATTTDVTYAGAAYTPVGPVATCGDTADQIVAGWESICYTLDGGDTVLPGTKRHDDRLPAPGFLVFDSEGNAVNTADPAYEQVVCSPEPDCCPVVLADDLCATGDRSVTSIRNADGTITLLDNATGATVDAADLIACPEPEDCCPIVLGRGCYDDEGTEREWVTLRAPDGAITGPMDSITGDTVDPGTIGECNGPEEAPPLTIVSHAANLNAGQAWTPAANVTAGETLLSVSFTVITGTANLVDSDATPVSALPVGFSMGWAVNDDNDTLRGPNSITAVGGRTVVNWTTRA